MMVYDDELNQPSHWKIEIDGNHVCDVSFDDTDVGAAAIKPLWEKLGIEMEFFEP
jgi:hypothetical protein